MSYTFMVLCPNHLRQEPLKVKEVFLSSGDRRYGAHCSVCGKKGPLRSTMHGARMAWNELVRAEREAKKQEANHEENRNRMD